MTAFAYVGGVEVPTRRIRQRGNGDQGIQVAAYADGTAAMAGVVFDDSDGSMVTQGWQSFIFEESACTDAPRLFTGYVGDRTFRRGHYRLGAGREIDTTILDANILLRMHRINGSDSLRPEETDTERLAWLMDSGYIPLVQDLGLINGANRVFEATQYKNQLPSDVLDDLIGPRGQIYFVYWDPNNEALGLFFDSPEATTFTSTLSISNVLSDVDNETCFAPDIDATSTIDPSEVYSNLAYLYKGGRVYRQNSDTADTFFSGDIGHRDAFVENDRVGKLATAITFADRILERDSVEAQSIDLVVRLPKEKVGLIQAGHRLQVRLSFVPGFETFTYTRVETWQAYHTDSTPDFYDVALHLSTRGKVGPGGGGDPGDFPHQPGGSVSLEGYNDNQQGVNDGNLPTAPGAGDLLVLFRASRTDVTDLGAISGWTLAANTHTHDFLFPPGEKFAALYYKTSDGTEGTEPYTEGPGELIAVFNWGEATFGQVIDINEQSGSTPLSPGSVTVTAGTGVVTCAVESTSDSVTYAVTPDSGVTELSDFVNNSGNHPYIWVGWKQPTTAGTYSVGGTLVSSDPSRCYWGAITYTIVGDEQPPSPGQPVPWEVVTMTGAEGTTAFPYATGSLQVKVDGVLISRASYTETIPDCGDFTLAWDPDDDEVVTVQYQAA